MPEIRLLDPRVSELIAAGEVVERPASAVKELMENAIDAGASKITVEIENGGVSLIRVTDNGCGIRRQDVPTAFLRHATSKVRTQEDLEHIGTLGFRGEALPSIAAVAKVELVTRTADELEGTRCVIEGGSEPQITDIGCPEGTAITVRDLFYNVPARMKFLKKDVSESNAVAAAVDCLALSHPEISVRFLRDGREGLFTPGDGDARSCIHAVCGREFANNLLPVEYSLGGVHVYGFICKPVAARSNRAMQHFFVNGRYVKTRTAAAALERGFQGSIMIGKFPSCVLHLDMPPETVDANVHPAKIEVRFINERPVFDAVFHAVRTALASEDAPKQASLPAAPAAEPEPSARQIPLTDLAPAAPAARSSGGFQKRPLVPPSGPRTVLRQETASLRGAPDILVDLPAPSPTGPGPVEPQQPDPPVQEEEQPVLYIGEAFNTYLIAQVGDRLVVIDKHAAHERILYNKLKNTHQQDAQMLLTPVPVQLSHRELEALQDNLSLLKEAGFEAEEFDGALLVRTVPMMLTGGDVPALIQEIASGFLSGRQEVTVDRLDWIYHSVACKAAVKAGDRESSEEAKALVARVLQDREVRYCPHGRPVCFELTKKELEKQFGRV